MISKTKVFELHEKFFKLPFQATKCKLAGESESHGHDPKSEKVNNLEKKGTGTEKHFLALSSLSPPPVFPCVMIVMCVCPGLEPFCQEPAVLKKFETMASGRILLAEILQRGQTPLVVLYDTSQDDDVNINAACMKALQDKTLASPLQVHEPCTCVCV